MNKPGGGGSARVNAVNIATMQLFRDHLGGRAVMVIELDSRPDADTLEAIRGVHAFRKGRMELFSNPAPGSIIPLETANRAITGYIRQKPGERGGVAVLGNTDMANPQPFTPPHSGAKADLLGGGELPEVLASAQVVAYEV